MLKKNQKGGDGYVVNVNEVIGGRPAFSRYSYNYTPIFDGSLLQNGGSCDIDTCDTIPVCNNCNKNTILNGGFKETKKSSKCGCTEKKSKSESLFDYILKGGNIKLKPIQKKIKSDINNKKLNQFQAIKQLSYMLQPLKEVDLVQLNIKLFLDDLHRKKPIKSKRLLEKSDDIQKIMLPLGKNNLLILGSLLLLNHYAKESLSLKKNGIELKKNIHIMKGGNDTLTSILTPLGLNQLGASVVLVLLQQAFFNKKISFNKKTQIGGVSPLKELIAPLGTNAFIATGLLIVLEKLITNQFKKNKSKKLVGGSNDFDKLFNMLAPITFNTFATKESLDKFNLMSNKKKKNT
jgi:hypothetical protein